jgi:hypothetical protein
MIVTETQLRINRYHTVTAHEGQPTLAELHAFAQENVPGYSQEMFQQQQAIAGIVLRIGRQPICFIQGRNPMELTPLMEQLKTHIPNQARRDRESSEAVHPRDILQAQGVIRIFLPQIWKPHAGGDTDRELLVAQLTKVGVSQATLFWFTTEDLYSNLVDPTTAMIFDGNDTQARLVMREETRQQISSDSPYANTSGFLNTLTAIVMARAFTLQRKRDPNLLIDPLHPPIAYATLIKAMIVEQVKKRREAQANPT